MGQIRRLVHLRGATELWAARSAGRSQLMTSCRYVAGAKTQTEKGDMSVDGWMMFGVWVQAVAVGGAALVAARQLRLSGKVRKEEARAYVVIYLDSQPDLREYPEIVISNLGRTIATTVKFEFSPELRSETVPDLAQVGMFATGIPAIVPGQQIRTLFDFVPNRPADWEDRYEVVVRFVDAFGDSQAETSVLDVNVLRKSHWIERKGLHALNDHLGKIEKELGRVSSRLRAPVPDIPMHEDRNAHAGNRPV